MHLRDAFVDNQGNAYGTGRLDFPVDSGGILRPTASPLVQVGFTVDGSVSIAACEASRDRKTGYLNPRKQGTVLHVPEAIARLLSVAIRHPHRQPPLEFALAVRGSLTSGTGDALVRQGLTDWRGSVQPAEDDAVRVVMSAALRSAPDPDWMRIRPEPWPRDEGDEPQRIEAAFVLDAVTRVVAFGAYSKLLSNRRGTEPTPAARNTLTGMRLEDAPLGPHGSIYGIARDDVWVRVYESKTASQRNLVLSPARSVRRADSGLLVEGMHEYPPIWFAGIDLDAVGGAMLGTRRFGVTLHPGTFGRVEYSGGSPDGPGEGSQLTSARLDFELTADGLVLEYSAYPEERPLLEGRVVIPWEALVIRSPHFVRHQPVLRTAGNKSPLRSIADQAKSKLKQAGENVKDAFR